VTVAVLAAAGAGIGIATSLHAGAGPPAVQRPNGLHASKLTYSSISLAWSKAMRGARPTKYEVFEDGGLIASVAGTATSYRVGELSPDEHHSFRLIAIHGKDQSPASTTLSVATTAAPAVSSAELTGGYKVTYIHPNSVGLEQPTTKLSPDNWDTAPRCASGPCSVQLSGQFQGHDFASTVLHRNGAVYTGQTTINNYFTCHNTYLLSYLTIRLKVTSADVSGSRWHASSWVGSFTATAPATDGCTRISVSSDIAGS